MATTAPVPDTPANPSYRLQAAEVLSKTFSIWASRFLPFLLVGLIVYSPCALLVWLLRVQQPGDGHEVIAGALEIVVAFLTVVLQGAVAYGVFQTLKGRSASLGAILRMGLFRIGSVLAATLLREVMVVLGLIVLCVPGIIFMCMFWVAIPVAVIEAPGGTRSLTRSSSLTEGSRGAIFSVALVLQFLEIVGGMLIGGLLGTLEERAPGAAFVLLLVCLIPIRCLQAVAPTVAYHDLRVGREGADVDELLRVFE
jgi:hypothetical protein